jgi:hypothetical protein
MRGSEFESQVLGVIDELDDFLIFLGLEEDAAVGHLHDFERQIGYAGPGKHQISRLPPPRNSPQLHHGETLTLADNLRFAPRCATSRAAPVSLPGVERNGWFSTAIELKWFDGDGTVSPHHGVFSRSGRKEESRESGRCNQDSRQGSRGENATFEIAENDPNWPRVEAFLSSMGDHWVRDFSTTVPYGQELFTLCKSVHASDFCQNIVACAGA